MNEKALIRLVTEVNEARRAEIVDFKCEKG